MKISAAALAGILCTATMAGAELLRGNRQLEMERKFPTLRRAPPGHLTPENSLTSIVDEAPAEEASEAPTQTEADLEEEPEEPEDCIPHGEAPFRTDEYVVVQFNSTLNEDKIIDFNDEVHQMALGVLYTRAYKQATGACDQKGALDEISISLYLSYNKDDDTFLLRVRRFTNAISAKFMSEFNGDCGPVLYDSSNPSDTLPVEFEARRRLEGECSCPVPTAAEVLANYNQELATQFDEESFSVFAIGTVQMCEDLDCKADKKGKTSYDSTGVCLPESYSEAPSDAPTESEEPSQAPTGTDAPSEIPTGTDSPSKTIVPTATDNPTREPTGEPTRDPTREPTREPTKEPTGEPSPEPTTPPTDATPVPTAPPTDATPEPSTQEPTPTTPAPSTQEPTPTTPAPSTQEPTPTTPAPSTQEPTPTTPAPNTPGPSAVTPAPTVGTSDRPSFDGTGQDPTLAPGNDTPAPTVKDTPAPTVGTSNRPSFDGTGQDPTLGPGNDTPAPTVKDTPAPTVGTSNRPSFDGTG